MTDDQPVLYCVNHPTVETQLRCGRCNDPICIKCAVRTPTGYKCRKCVRGQQKVFDTAQWYDYPLAFLFALVLSFIGSILVSYIGFFTIFIAPVIGTIIAEVIRLVTRRRRSRYLFLIAAGSVVLGALLPLAGSFLSALLGSGIRFALFDFLWQAVYAFLATSTVYYRLSGIQMRR